MREQLEILRRVVAAGEVSAEMVYSANWLPRDFRSFQEWLRELDGDAGNDVTA